MKILHISTLDKGGAAKAAIRTHLNLVENQLDSNILFLYAQQVHPITNSITYHSGINNKPNNFILEFLFRFLKLKKPKQQKEKNEKLLKNQVKGFEMFSFASSDYDITKHQAYQEADIIHLHWVANFIDFNFFKKNKKPIVWTLHDMNPFTGGCHYSIGCIKFKIDCAECPQLHGTINPNSSNINFLKKRKVLAKQNLEIVTPSKWLSSLSKESSLFKRYRHTVIPYTLDLSIFKPLNKDDARNTLGLPLSKPILLFVSENIENERKGFNLLLNALQKLDLPDLQLVCIGKKQDNLDIVTNLHFLGEISDEYTMALAYNAADAFVLPSLEDNLPNVMLESLCVGTPVISLPNGGANETIHTGINGIIAHEITEESLSEAITTFYNSKSSFNNQLISEHAHISFSGDKHFESYIAMYKSVYTKK